MSFASRENVPPNHPKCNGRAADLQKLPLRRLPLIRRQQIADRPRRKAESSSHCWRHVAVTGHPPKDKFSQMTPAPGADILSHRGAGRAKLGG
jgi:hypothetical protein